MKKTTVSVYDANADQERVRLEEWLDGCVQNFDESQYYTDIRNYRDACRLLFRKARDWGLENGKYKAQVAVAYEEGKRDAFIKCPTRFINSYRYDRMNCMFSVVPKLEIAFKDREVELFGKDGFTPYPL